jgi:hypothetical protein
MEIVHGKSIADCEYTVLKGIYLRGREDKKTRGYVPGEKIIFHEKVSLTDVLGYCHLGAVVPVGIPEIGTYRARRDLSIRIKDRVEKVERGELIELSILEAFPRLLNGAIEPRDPYGWSGNRLVPPKKTTKEDIEHANDRLSSMIAGGKPRIGLDFKVRK